MPEGPECRIITDKIRARVKGKYLLSLGWTISTKYCDHFNYIWPQIQHLFPAKCLDIICRGKQIFFFFDNAIAFTSSLGIEGHWYYFKAGQSSTYLSDKNYNKFCLFFGSIKDADIFTLCINEDELWYDDMISYGNFTVTNWQGAFNKMMEIGPDLLATVYPIQDIDRIVQENFPAGLSTPITIQKYSSERSEEHTSELQSHSFISYAVFCLKKKIKHTTQNPST